MPLLPSRIHLAQSRFVTLKGAERREMTFDDMTKDDPTRIDEQMVVTVDGQPLLYGKPRFANPHFIARSLAAR